ncbi:MAG: DoxX family membrane protein [Desulfobacteraceae bacterium]|nr:DoxX family membrane protein [Desulfobacteraceae bacterium]
MLTDNNWAELAARWFLGITFIYASYHKITDPASFAKIIYGYGLVPGFLINLLAIVLPFLELVSGAALIIGVYPRSAAIIVNGMLFVFIVALSVNLIRGHEFDCGCFSFGKTESGAQLLMRDIIYFVFGLQVIFFNKSRRWCIQTLSVYSFFLMHRTQRRHIV